MPQSSTRLLGRIDAGQLVVLGPAFLLVVYVTLLFCVLAGCGVPAAGMTNA